MQGYTSSGHRDSRAQYSLYWCISFLMIDSLMKKVEKIEDRLNGGGLSLKETKSENHILEGNMILNN